MASTAAFPHTIVQPRFLQSWQSNIGLVLHILLSGLGGGAWEGNPPVVSWCGVGGVVLVQARSSVWVVKE